MADENKTLDIDHTWWGKFRAGEIGLNGGTDGCHKEFMQKLVKEIERYSCNPEFISGVLSQLCYAAQERETFKNQSQAAALKHLLARKDVV